MVLALQATKGPWIVEEVPEADKDPPAVADEVCHGGNRAFIAAARTGWPFAEEAVLTLVAEVRRLQALTTPSPACERAAPQAAERQLEEMQAQVERLRCLVSETRAAEVRQRVEGKVVTTELSIANWLDAQADAVDPGQPSASEVVAELRRRAAEVRSRAWREDGKQC